jgi:hypothetical protein
VPHVRGHYRQGPWYRSVWVRPHYRKPRGSTTLLVAAAVVVIVVFLIWAL